MKHRLFVTLAVVGLTLCSGVAAFAQSASSAEGPRADEAVTPAATEDFAPALHDRYRLAATDVLELHFPYVPEFNETVPVQPDGYIALKNVGEVKAAGHTLAELHDAILAQYADVLKNPAVTIVLKDFRKPYVVVAGEVARPGRYDLRGPMTLTEALAVAGGYTTAAKHSQVVIFRKFTEDRLEVKQIDVKKMYASHDVSEDPLLRDGDTILVPKSLLGKIGPWIARASLGLYLNPFQQ
jgi:polysaccharide export outer membrane protein